MFSFLEVRDAAVQRCHYASLKITGCRNAHYCKCNNISAIAAMPLASYRAWKTIYGYNKSVVLINAVVNVSEVLTI